MSGDEHPSTTASHWRDTNPPLFTKERLETSSGTSTSFDTATLLALFVFVGVVPPMFGSHDYLKRLACCVRCAGFMCARAVLCYDAGAAFMS